MARGEAGKGEAEEAGGDGWGRDVDVQGDRLPGPGVTDARGKRPFFVFLAMLLGFTVTARVTISADGVPGDLVVTDGSRRIVCHPAEGRRPHAPLTEKVTASGATITCRGLRLTSSRGGGVDAVAWSRRLYPSLAADGGGTMALRSKGGRRVGTHLLWLFAWDNPDAAGEPSGPRFLLDVPLKPDGALGEARALALRGLGANLNWLDTGTFGHRVILSGWGMSEVDLDAWREVAASPGGEYCYSVGGTLYRDDAPRITAYNPKADQWDEVGYADMGEMLYPLTVDGHDYLIFQRGIFADRHCYYRYPGSDRDVKTLYAIPTLGLAFLGDLPPQTPGLLLTHTTLTPLTIIQRS